MSREKTLVKNTALLTIGKICTQMITFFLLPLYTAILSTEEFGIVDLLNTLVSLLLPIITFQIEQALFRNLIDVRDNEQEKKKIISTGIFTVLGQSIIYLLIFLIISPFVNNEYKYFLVTNVIAYVFASIFHQIARGLGNNKEYAISSFISALVTIVTNVALLVPIKLGAKGMLIGNLLGQVVCSLYLLVSLKLHRYISFKEFEYELLKKLWKYSLPLVPSVISWWIFNASDRVIVSGLLGVGQNGILSAAHKFSSVYITFFNIFNMSWTEMVAMQIKDDDIEEFFNRMFNTMVRLFVAMGIGIIACMPFVYPLMIDNKFSEGYFQVPIMILSSIASIIVSLLAALYIANKDTKTPAKAAAFAAIINVIVHLVMINYIGLYAATISTLVAYTVMCIHRVWDINKKYFKVSIDNELLIKASLVLSGVLIIYYSNNILFYAMGVLLAIIFAWDLNRKSIDQIITVLKRKLNKA